MYEAIIIPQAFNFFSFLLSLVSGLRLLVDVLVHARLFDALPVDKLVEDQAEHQTQPVDLHEEQRRQEAVEGDETGPVGCHVERNGHRRVNALCQEPVYPKQDAKNNNNNNNNNSNKSG